MRKTIFLVAARHGVPKEFSLAVEHLASRLEKTPGYEVYRGSNNFLSAKPDLVVLIIDHERSDSEIPTVLRELEESKERPPMLAVLSASTLEPCKLIERIESYGGDVRLYRDLAPDALGLIQAKFSALAVAA
jgi:hypothetical protein